MTMSLAKEAFKVNIGKHTGISHNRAAAYGEGSEKDRA
jgi:hypothetical protein